MPICFTAARVMDDVLLAKSSNNLSGLLELNLVSIHGKPEQLNTRMDSRSVGCLALQESRRAARQENRKALIQL